MNSVQSSPIEENYTDQEKQMITNLEQLLKTYEDLLKKIEKEMETIGMKHDELAACDAWWNETDEKITATTKLLELLKKI
jgi:hypothetical protein